jgi:hypothetical protein
VTSGQRLGFKAVEDRVEDPPPEAWHRLSAGDGAKGPRRYDWACLPYRSGAAPGWHKGLLVRRRIARPEGLTFYLTHAPEETALADLVRVAGTRWTIEACFGAAKGEVGLDRYEVRSWTGWHRHVTLALLAHACLTVIRGAASGGRAGGRPAGRASAAHRPRGAPSPLVSGVGTPARSRPDRRPVALAPPAPAARPPLPLAPTHPLP